MLFIAERVARRGVLETDRRGNVAGVNGLDILTMVGVHLQDTAHALTNILGGVENGGAGVECTGIDAEEAQAADIGVGHDLECQGGERLVIARLTLVFFVRLRVDTLDGGDIGRRGHIVHNGIEQLLHALVAVGRTADHRDHLDRDGRLADRCADLGGGDLLALKIHLHDLIVEHGNGVEHLLTVFLRELAHILGDLLHAHILAHFVVVDVRIHLDQVDDAAEFGFLADGQLDGHRIALETLVDHAQDVIEVRAHDVHFVDVDHAGHMVVIRLTPNRLALRLNAALGAHDGHRAVEHAEAALHLDREVDVARGVDDVDAMVLPEARRGGRRNGDAALLLLLHPVHRRSTLVGLAELVVDACVVQDTLGRGGLACIDVGHDADISCFLQRYFSRHKILLAFLPAEVGERLVGLGHLVGIFALLHSRAGVVGGVHELAGETLGHGALTAGAGVGRQPTQTEGLTTGGTNLHRDLIVGAADTAGLGFENGHDVFHRLSKDVERLIAGLFLDDVKRTVDDLLCNALLAVEHDAVDELGHEDTVVHRIGQNFSLGNITSSGHFASLLLII